MSLSSSNLYVFFFNDTATTEIYTLSLHDALPICEERERPERVGRHAHPRRVALEEGAQAVGRSARRSEEHTSELQSRQYLVCRLLLEKKKKDADDILWLHTSYYYCIHHVTKTDVQ